jgi:sugar phosphate isomerase/epimerase
MLNRRDFGKLSISAMAALAANKLFATANKPIGVQLYTVREQVKQDLPGTLKKIREIGYQQVEGFGEVYQKRSAGEVRRLIQDAGLTMPSCHFGYEEFESRLDYARELGLKYMVCPMLPKTMWTLDGFKEAAEQFNKWGAAVEKRGMKFAFHNHNYEFRQLGEANGYHTLMTGTDPKLVFFELDTYWAAEAGRDPLKMMQMHPARIRLLHLKDRKPGFPPSQQLDDNSKHFTEVGSGTLDWKAILAQAEKNKVDYLYVEQDQTDGPVFESLRTSYDYLHKLLAA